MGAVGSTLGGSGGLIVFVMYLIFGPGGLIYNLGRLVADKFRKVSTISVREYDNARRYALINACITVLPFAIWALSLL